MKPVDQAQRLAALNPLRSVCVTAPAGSGKTELLSQRVLTLLARVEQPEEILAITFTRKAAAEMHHRIIAALEFAAESPEPEEGHRQLTWQLARAALLQDKQQGWRLLFNPQRLKIQTIDSLCSSLTRQMPLLADFGAQPQLSDDAEPSYRQAVLQLLAHLETSSFIADDLVVLLKHLDNDLIKTQELLISLLRQRDQWLHHIYLNHNNESPRHVLESTLAVINKDLLQQLTDKLQPLAAELLGFWDYAGANLKAVNSESIVTSLAGICELPPCDGSDFLPWLAIAEMLLTGTGDWRKQLTKNNGFPTETLDGDKKQAKQRKQDYLELLAELKDVPLLADLLTELRLLPSLNYHDEQWLLMESLTRVLPVLVAELKIVFQQQGEVDFSQMSIAALQALGDGLNPTELMMKLDYRLSHILIDEFQDTASTQFELLKRLVEGWAEYNQQNPDNPNTLFLVGDGMQSIYSFREAKVGLFLEARKQGVNGVELDDLPLSVNFRSSETVVNWNNEVFQQAFPRQENLSRGAVPYELSVAFNQDALGSNVSVFGFTGDRARQLEAEKTLELVQQSLKQNPTGSIAILVRSRNHLADILPLLTAANLTWQATDIDPLAGSAAIIDLLSLTKALLNVADEVSWAALLRSPLCGLDNKDLFELLSARNDNQSCLCCLNDLQRVSRLSADGQVIVSRLTKAVGDAFERRDRLPLRVWLEGLWCTLGGPASLGNDQQMQSVMRFFELLERYQVATRLESMTQFERAVKKLYAAPQVTDSPIQVMTIHKSKGLEFDTVILPGLARKPRGNDHSLLMWREYLSCQGETGLIMSPPAAAGNDVDSIYRYLRNEQSLAGSLENTRLLYVAATRAVNKLYVLFTTDWDEKKQQPSKPNKQSLMTAIWPAVEEAVEWQHEVVGSKPQLGFDFEQQAATADEVLRRLPVSWQAPEKNFSNPLASFYFDRRGLDDDGNLPDLNTDQLPRQQGNIVHRVLQQLAESGVDQWHSMNATIRHNWLIRLMEREGVETNSHDATAEFIKRSINNTVNDPDGQWLLSQDHQRSVAEYALLTTIDGQIKKRVIDRSFIDNSGIRWVVDYKTSEPNDGESRQDFIDREVTQYRGQLMQYKWYLNLLAGNSEGSPSIKTGLYFTSLGHWQVTNE